MNLEQMAAQVAAHVTPVNIVLFVLLAVTTVMAESSSIKGSSVWGLGKALIMTLIDQVKPQAETAADATKTVSQ